MDPRQETIETVSESLHRLAGRMAPDGHYYSYGWLEGQEVIPGGFSWPVPTGRHYNVTGSFRASFLRDGEEIVTAQQVKEAFNAPAGCAFCLIGEPDIHSATRAARTARGA